MKAMIDAGAWGANGHNFKQAGVDVANVAKAFFDATSWRQATEFLFSSGKGVLRGKIRFRASCSFLPEGPGAKCGQPPGKTHGLCNGLSHGFLTVA